LAPKDRARKGEKSSMSANLSTSVVDWITPDDSAWLQSADAPPGLVDRICEGFRVAVWRPAPSAPPSAWQASTLQQGEVGFLDPPGALSGITRDQATALLKFSKDAFAPSAGLIQLMLPADDDVLESSARAAGLDFVANLLLLGRSCAQQEIEPLDPALHFAACGLELPHVIENTYEGTLDCPMLTGKRATSDVIKGYAATGSTGKTYWRTLFASQNPIGCVLVATHPKLEIAELVYMGLVPPARGLGIGGHLLMEAERLTLASGLSKLVIGVDAANAPARKHYEDAGYLVWERKRVFLWLAANHSP
jgi:ribosomal protein S18 acetylase RimI-like enzyme